MTFGLTTTLLQILMQFQMNLVNYLLMVERIYKITFPILRNHISPT